MGEGNEQTACASLTFRDRILGKPTSFVEIDPGAACQRAGVFVLNGGGTFVGALYGICTDLLRMSRVCSRVEACLGIKAEAAVMVKVWNCGRFW